MKNIIPTAQNLIGKGVQLVNRCNMCFHEGETSRHIIFECRLSQKIWEKICPKVIELLPCSDMDVFWQGVFMHLQKDNLLELFCITWLIGSNRNRCFHDSLCHSPRKIINSACILNAKFQQVTRKETIQVREQLIQWKPPPEGVLKINADAAYKE